MSANFEVFINKESYTDFNKKMIDAFNSFILKDDRIKKSINNLDTFIPYDKDNNYKVKICSEPSFFIKNITSKKYSDEKISAFYDEIENFSEYEFIKPNSGIWMNTTCDGINLRLGHYEMDSGRFDPQILSDDCVHGLIVGRTGSGKSVLLNNIILNLLTEYAPWELDLYMVDMKKVELSRYMKLEQSSNRYITPHIKILGATSEVRYVVSMLKMVYNYMQDRQNLFAALDVKKIKDFREKYNVVLPRILVLIDEFQQLFSEATNHERVEIDNYITSITKLGRATGVHLLFASQDMSGALDSKTLANFKLRIALPCDEAISNSILGNVEAATIAEKGITIVNNKGGSNREDNIRYKTPYIEDKEMADSKSEFERVLYSIYDENLKIDFKKNQKYYNEDVLEDINIIKKIKSSDEVIKKFRESINSNTKIYELLVLGTKVLCTDKKNEISYINLEKDKKRSIGIICKDNKKMKIILETLLNNFKYTNNIYHHNFMIECEGIELDTDSLANENNEVIKTNFTNFNLDRNYEIIKLLRELDYSVSHKNCLETFILNYAKHKSDDFYKKIFKDYNYNSGNDFEYLENTIKNSFNNIESEYSDIESVIKVFLDDAKYRIDILTKIIKDNSEKFKEFIYLIIATNLIQEINPKSKKCLEENRMVIKTLNMSLKNGKYAEIIRINWIIGTETIDKNIDRKFYDVIENSSLYNEIFILVGNHIDNLELSFKNCNYIFLYSNNESDYNAFRMEWTKKGVSDNNFSYKNTFKNEEFVFKHFYIDEFKNDEVSIDLNDIDI